MIQFPIYPVRIVPADCRKITKLARQSPQRRLQPKASGAHLVDEFPHPPLNVPADASPIVVTHLSFGARHIGAIGKRQSIQAAIKPRTSSAQRVVAAAGQLGIG
jgi:hypothetical protein